MSPILVLSLVSGFAPPAASTEEFFETRVRPVLVQHCSSCHGGKKLKGGLSLESREALLAGGDSGPAIVPGKPDESRLVTAVRYADVALQMPPKGKLTDADVAAIAAWVEAGAPWPKSDAKPAAAKAAFDLAARKQSHWAWQPVRPVAIPTVRNREWVRDPADAFILSKLESLGLLPASPTDALTWLRRATFALTGLPPTPAEVEAFARDSGPVAREAVVDRLLVSPAFGEHWGRHWLDLVRYAETRGHEFDPPIPNAYQYRDYVVRAINADVPYDALVREHLAGDLLATPRRDPATGANESVLGTGFWFLGEEVHSPVDIRQDQADRFDNKIDVMTKAFLGLTVACARCHDHKFDAISARDYYALYGFLSSSHYRQVRFDDPAENDRVASELADARLKSEPSLVKALGDAAAEIRVVDYLLAVRDVLNAGEAKAKLRVADVARSRNLELDRLAAWLQAVRDAAKDPADPLHAWAKLCVPAAKPTAARPEGAAPAVFDFSRQPPGMQESAAFAWMPKGALTVRGTPVKPVLEFNERAAVVYDLAWDALRAAPGTDPETGRLGGMSQRSGRTFRTSTFKITSDTIHVLARGDADVYAAVGSHIMIQGPLHGKLVVKLTGSGAAYRWHRLDLARYRGLNVHLEFTPAIGSNFAIAAVAQGEATPTSVAKETSEDLASGIEASLRRTAKQLQVGPLTGIDWPAANWFGRHLELLPDRGRSVIDVAASRLKDDQRIASSLRAESRLAPAMIDGSGVDERVFIRGASSAEGEPAPRRFLEALDGAVIHPPHGSGRRELAAIVTDPVRNPFIARVAVNRVWHHLFGRGIVASVDNFGVLGDRPTHPELLDHLADRFVRDGWSMKRLIKSLVLSNTFTMSSARSPEGDRLDPSNLHLHRARLHRLEAESIRDSILAVSGRLDRKQGGPSIPIHLTEFLDGRGRPKASGSIDGNGRRSLYLAMRRNYLSPMLAAFDQPVPFSTVGRRSVSNVPAQSLILMNDPFVHQQARIWGERIHASAGSAEARIHLMYLEAFARSPSDDEVKACAEFLAKRSTTVEAWAALAHVLFNAKEFIFLG